MQVWFASDAACLDYLEWLRWPDGFVCPSCGGAGGWRLGDGRWRCRACGSSGSVTAGTIFDRTRTPLTVWFAACWAFATAKDGVSALSLKRTLEIGSYQTAWAMLQRLRSVLVRPDRQKLAGRVEVDETYYGGKEAGLRGGRAPGKKALVGVAVEADDAGVLGRCRMGLLGDLSADSLVTFVTRHVEPGSLVVTDAWKGYLPIAKAGFAHEWRSQRAARKAGENLDALLPGVHRIASLFKRWLLGTHQGAVGSEHLQAYMDEFVFRFNRRRSRSRGMLFYRVLELAVRHEPVRYRDLIADPRPRSTSPTPPTARGRPPSLERPYPHRPWRKPQRDKYD